MAIEAKINANCLNMQFFMNRVNQCKSVSKNYLLPILPTQPKPPGYPLSAIRYPLYAIRTTRHESRFYKTNPIFKNAKRTETYVQKGLMKHLPRATAEKTKPICKNAKTNLTFCLEMTYENNHLFRLCKNEPNFQAWPPAERRPRTHESRATSHESRGKTYDFAKQTQFSKNQNEPKYLF